MNQLTVTDVQAAQANSDKIIIGKSFAFVPSEIFDNPGNSGPRKFHIVPLLGPTPVQLPGVEIKPLPLDITLRSLTCDKSVYRADRDQVNLFVLSPTASVVPLNVEIRGNGAVLSRHQVQSGPHGEAQLKLKNLPVGEYEAAFAGETDAKCNFSVAEYRLVPLVATLVNRVAEKDGRLSVKLSLDTYGKPVTGEVRIDVLDGANRQDSVIAQALDGHCSFLIELKGAGPHALSVQLLSDSAKTASVPLTGSRTTERSLTVFCPLGTQTIGSMLPSATSREVRGLYLEDGSSLTSLVSLDRVDTDCARLQVHAPIETLQVVVIDPTAMSLESTRKKDSEIRSAEFPEKYTRADDLFKQGKLVEALELFLELHTAANYPHPYYSYYIACCHARLNRREEALVWLKHSINEGWWDYAHMAADKDLESLHGWGPFDSLMGHGYREVMFEDVTAGQVLDIEVTGPISVIAIGAVSSGRPWEGWTSVVKPSTGPPRINVEKRCEAGGHVTIDVEPSGRPDPLIYALVKDARLVSADTPVARLAACLKAYVETTSERLAVHWPAELLLTRLNTLAVSDRSPGAKTILALRSLSDADIDLIFRKLGPGQTGGTSQNKWGDLKAPVELEGAIGENTPASARPRSTLLDDPEVLFAGFIPVTDGRAALKLKLPDVIADYVIEIFVTAELEWSSAQATFRAEKDPFIEFMVPVFAREGESTFGSVHVSSQTKAVRLMVLKDGERVALLDGVVSVSASDPVTICGEAKYTFAVSPGIYEAILEDTDGSELDRRCSLVNEPGKINRLVKPIRLLEAGQFVSRANNPQILSLAVLPGLDSSFNALVRATADYAHACCEQTAAKVLCAALLYLTSKNNEEKEMAQAAVLAGIAREQTMWLRDRGFKMYPESDNTPHAFYTPKVARYLFYLSSMVGETTRSLFSVEMRTALALAGSMAVNASQAVGLKWPPTQISSCEDAYAAIRFGNNGAASILNLIRKQRKGSSFAGSLVKPDPHLGTKVGQRAELAYASATLLRGGLATDIPKALELASSVIDSFNGEGRLYSTVDSIPAIVLMSELQRAGVTADSARVEIDGTLCSLTEARARAGTISSVKVLAGVVAIEACLTVVEDWSTFCTDMQIRVALEKGGKAQRSFLPGDEVDLHVRIETGYVAGDILWVCLPDVLSRLVGGAQAKLFAVDFQGKDHLRIPLAVTGTTRSPFGKDGKQSLMICVRNMFNEERGISAGQMQLSVGSLPQPINERLFAGVPCDSPAQRDGME